MQSGGRFAVTDDGAAGAEVSGTWAGRRYQRLRWQPGGDGLPAHPPAHPSARPSSCPSVSIHPSDGVTVSPGVLRSSPSFLRPSVTGRRTGFAVTQSHVQLQAAPSLTFVCFSGK